MSYTMIKFLNRIKKTYLKPTPQEVEKTLHDINLFYAFFSEYYDLAIITKNEQDLWYFKSVFSDDYSRYLQSFNYLNKEALNLLHEGVMSILIFQCYIGVFDSNTLSTQKMAKTYRLLKKLKLGHVKSRLLRNQLYKAIWSTKRKNAEAAIVSVMEAIDYINQHIVRQVSGNKSQSLSQQALFTR